MKVRLPERVLDEIEAKVHGRTGEVVGGLLLGFLEDGGYWIERVLACPNAAERGSRDRSFAVDPGALANVRATLAPTALRVLGLYFGGGDPAGRSEIRVRSTAPDEALRLVPTSNGHGRTEPRVWTAADTAAVTRVEVVPERVPALPYCPE